MTVTVSRHSDAEQIDEEAVRDLRQDLERSVQRLGQSSTRFGMALNEALLQAQARVAINPRADRIETWEATVSAMPPDAEVMYDKEIALVSGSSDSAGHLVGVLVGSAHVVRIAYGGSIVEHTGSNFFEALASVREDLEGEGLKPAIEGACRDVYPSRMALEMGGGRRAYRWPSSGRPFTVDIFDAVLAADYEKLSYVSEQSDANRYRRRRNSE